MSEPEFNEVLVWFRRDLRYDDHAALSEATQRSRRVICVFVFDREILDALPADDRRLPFIHASVDELDRALRELGGGLLVRHGQAQQEIPRLAAELGVDAVFANRDYEPAAKARDAAVARRLQEDGRQWRDFKDQVIFDRDEVLTRSGTPFSVFTPYKNAWLRRLQENEAAALPVFDVAPAPGQLQAIDEDIPGLETLGFGLGAPALPAGMSGATALLDDFAQRLHLYQQTRDYPARKGPSYLSVHLRFGTISVRGLVRHALAAMRTGSSAGASIWLSELVWRDFYFMVLDRHPHVVQQAFKSAFDAIVWEHGAEAERRFLAWCEGNTGYPLVDAGMRQLNASGYMHNRLRMVTASFLVKDLGIDWRRGERYFARQLNDYDLAANNGGWQWAASTGCDAQPWFRIFNPVTQSEKFDPDGRFIRRYLPQLAQLPDKYLHAPWRAPEAVLKAAGIVLGVDYPIPLVDHDTARRETLSRYAVVKEKRDPEPGLVD